MATCTECAIKNRETNALWRVRVGTRRKGGHKATEAEKRRVALAPCEMCGFKPLHPCQTDLDHVDGNNKNHAEENLWILCSNCHRLKSWHESQIRRGER